MSVQYLFILSTCILSVTLTPTSIKFQYDSGTQPDTANVEFTVNENTVYARTLNIKLWKNTNVIPSATPVISNCQYHGFDINFQNTDAVFSLCDKGHFSGVVLFNNGLGVVKIERCMIMEECDDKYNVTISGVIPHSLYKRDVQQDDSNITNRYNTGARTQINNDTLYLRLLITTDEHYEKVMDQNGVNVINSVLYNANIVSMFMRQLNIVMYLTNYVRVHVDYSNLNGSMYLNKLRNIHNGLSITMNSFDVMIMLTNGMLSDKFDVAGSGKILGMSYGMGVCRNYGVGFAMIKSYNVLDSSTVILHEIAHILGVDHDGSSGKNCTCINAVIENDVYVLRKSSICIMHPHQISSEITQYTYSDCSISEFKTARVRYDAGCMKSPPPYHITSCGNGIIDVGETCDCGALFLSNKWDDRCGKGYCDMTTCQLKNIPDNIGSIGQCVSPNNPAHEYYVIVFPTQHFIAKPDCRCVNIFHVGSKSCVSKIETVDDIDMWFTSTITRDVTYKYCKDIAVLAWFSPCKYIPYTMEINDTIVSFDKYSVYENDSYRNVLYTRKYGNIQYNRKELYSGVCGYSLYHCDCNKSNIGGVAPYETNANNVMVFKHNKCSWMSLYRMLLHISPNGHRFKNSRYCIEIPDLSEDFSDCLKFFKEHSYYVNKNDIEFSIRYSDSTYIPKNIYLIVTKRRIKLAYGYFGIFSKTLRFKTHYVKKGFLCINSNTADKFMSDAMAITCKF